MRDQVEATATTLAWRLVGNLRRAARRASQDLPLLDGFDLTEVPF
jgi:hypothetical protein